TVVQKEFLIKDYTAEFCLLEDFLRARKWVFNPGKFAAIQGEVGTDGVVVVGDFYSPLKMLHLTMGPINSVYFLMEHPEKAKLLLDIHEEAQLKIIRETMENGVKVIMAMDNLDTMFHPPEYVRQYSASFYEKASSICHEYGGKFFIHACGNQKDNLELIASLGVDGLEGVVFPPMGNVELDEAMELSSGNFIITGGISAVETKELKIREEVFNYVENLFTRLKPYKNRFIFAASCNTAINTPWETIKHFRDAWNEFKSI
ncbi:uroporphyrinogen decarboxylase family protein, partial [Bacteroidota bacterium]